MSNDEARKKLLEKFQNELREAISKLSQVKEIRDLAGALVDITDVQMTMLSLMASQMNRKDGEFFIRKSFSVLGEEAVERFKGAMAFITQEQAYMN